MSFGKLRRSLAYLAFRIWGTLLCHVRFRSVTLNNKILEIEKKNLLFEIGVEMPVASYCTTTPAAAAVHSVLCNPGRLAPPGTSHRAGHGLP